MIECSGMNQKTLAESCGVSQGSVINWKRGGIPKSEELHRLSKLFGVSMEWLLTGEESGDSPAPSGVPWQERAKAAEYKLAAVKEDLQKLLKKI
jgi:transcriptional regulator with XRE-family HTH domain